MRPTEARDEVEENVRRLGLEKASFLISLKTSIKVHRNMVLPQEEYYLRFAVVQRCSADCAGFLTMRILN